MSMIVDHKKFGCKTIFQDWSGDEGQDDKISKVQGVVQLSTDSYQEHQLDHESSSINRTYHKTYTNIESSQKSDSSSNFFTNRQYGPHSTNHHHGDQGQYSTHCLYNHYNQPSTNLNHGQFFNNPQYEQFSSNSSQQPHQQDQQDQQSNINQHYEQISTKQQFNHSYDQHCNNYAGEQIKANNANNGQFTRNIQHNYTSVNFQNPQNDMPAVNNKHYTVLSTIPKLENLSVSSDDSFSMNSTIPDPSPEQYFTNPLNNQSYANQQYDPLSTTPPPQNPDIELSSADLRIDFSSTNHHSEHLPSIRPFNKPSENQRHECGTCGRVFNTAAKLKIHKNCHAKRKTFVCDICQKSFFTFYHLKNHMRKHDGRTPFKCDYCRKHFTTGTGLSIHMRRHVGKQTQRCTVCDKTFPAPYHLKKHMIKHTKEKRFECNICQKRFSRQGSLHVHQRLHSSASPRYQCDLCPKRFHWQSNLKAHRPTHFDGCTRCDICKRKFDSCEELELHGTFHSANVQFQCVWCEKSYTSRHKLHYHIKNSHVKLPSYQCEECDKSFKFLQQLKIHRIVHTDKKPRCYLCNKTFLTKYNLQSHLTSHVSTKSFECDICSIKFTYKRNLYIHLKRHALARVQNSTDFQNLLKERRKNMKKLKCGTCGREFAYRKSLEKCDHKRRLINSVKPTKVSSKSKNGSVVREQGDSASMNTIDYFSHLQMRMDENTRPCDNIKVQVNIMLGDLEQPLWELNLPSAREEEKRPLSPVIEKQPPSPVFKKEQPLWDPNLPPTREEVMEKQAIEKQPQSRYIEKETLTCDVTEFGDYYYFPAYLNANLGSSEPIDFSMGFLPSTATNYSPFTAIPADEPLDYSFHNVRLINNVTYRDL